MVDNTQTTDDDRETEGTAPAAAPAAPRRSSGHRGTDVRDTVAEMTARAQEISMEAGSKIASAMKDVINAAAGLTGFAIESARDLVQYMIRRGQMTQDEAERLMRDVEAAHTRFGGAPRPAPVPAAEPVVTAAPVAATPRPAVRSPEAKAPEGKAPEAKAPEAKAPEAKAPAARPASPAKPAAKVPATRPAAKAAPKAVPKKAAPAKPAAKAPARPAAKKAAPAGRAKAAAKPVKSAASKSASKGKKKR